MNEPSTIYGNYEDKYNATNPVSKILVAGFLRAFDKNIHDLSTQAIDAICEVGCAEGELLKRIYAIFPETYLAATDLSEDEIIKAKNNCASIQVDFSVQNAEKLNIYADSSFDLVVCCEVLEHLHDPAQGLRELHRISKKYVLVSVPNEPIWRMLNLIRGKYIGSWGNTPGHLNHWTIKQFPEILKSANFTLKKRNYPLPWQMILLEKQ